MDSINHRGQYGPSWSPHRSSYLGKATLSNNEMGEKGQEPIFSNTFLSRFGQRSLAFFQNDIGGGAFTAFADQLIEKSVLQ